TDIAAAAGIIAPLIAGGAEKQFIVEAKGGGAAFLDYNLDGLQDLYVVNGSTLEFLEGRAEPGLNKPFNHLYRNNGDGTFADVTAQAGVGDDSWGYGCVAADYDNDGDEDIYVTNFGRNVLYRNNGDGTFTDVTDEAGVNDERFSTGSTFGDYDKDGDLDLYVSNFVIFELDNLPNNGEWCEYVGEKVFCGPLGFPGSPDAFFLNNGDGTFTEFTEQAGLKEESPYYGFTPVFEDFDNNGTLDLYVPNDSCTNYLYSNLGDGRFMDIGTSSGVALSEDARPQASMGIAVADYDQDGWMDIFLTHFSNDFNTLYHNEGSMIFADKSYDTGLAVPSYSFVSWGTFFFDFDNDGNLDIFVANGHTYPSFSVKKQGMSYKESNHLFLNQGNGRFMDASARMGEDFRKPKVSRGAAYADIDNDGDLDIFITELDGPPTLLRNDLDNGNHFISVKLFGTTSNRQALGSRIEVSAGGKRQIHTVRCGGSFLSHNDLRAHFGLGASSTVDLLKITWPTGEIQEHKNIPADRFIEITEGSDQIR
ncbi:CRTAC1 family protein, partial [Acidobacteriota bacterium]